MTNIEPIFRPSRFERLEAHLAALRLLCGRSEWESAKASMGTHECAVEALCRISAVHGRLSGRPTTELPELPGTEVRDER